MLRDIRSLGRETAVYGLSSVLARLLNLLLLPFYTHFLAPGENGVLAAVFSYIAFLNAVYQCGMDQAYMRRASEPGASREEAFSTAFLWLCGCSLLFSAAVHLAAEPLARLGGIGDPALARLAAWVLSLDALASVAFADLRLAHRPWAYAAARTANIAVNLAATVALVGGAGLGARGVLLAALCASAAALLLLAPVFARRLRAAFSGEALADMLRFGLPLVPAGLGAMAVQVVDRPILLKMLGEEAAGVYQINYRLGVFMMMVVGMFDQAWRPFVLDRAREPEGPALFARVLTCYLAAASWLAAALALFMPELVRLPFAGRPLIHPAYWSGLGIVPVVLAANMLHGVYVIFMSPVIIKKRTDLLVWVTFLGAAVDIGANLALVPAFGIRGAAWAALSAHAAMALALLALGRRLLPVPYEWRRLLHAGGALAAVLLGLGLARREGVDGGAWLAARAAALLAYPAVLWVSGFPLEDEKRALSKGVRAFF